VAWRANRDLGGAWSGLRAAAWRANRDLGGAWSGLRAAAWLEPDRTVAPIVRHQRGTSHNGGEQRPVLPDDHGQARPRGNEHAGRPVMTALPADPHPTPQRVIFDELGRKLSVCGSHLAASPFMRPLIGARPQNLKAGLLLFGVLGAAGCGGSGPAGSRQVNSNATGTATGRSAVHRPSASTAPSGVGAGGGSGTGVAGGGSGTGGVGGGSGAGGVGGAGGGSGATGPGGGSNARVPATFTVTTGRGLQPSTVAAPASIAIEVTVVSGDGRPHFVTVASRSLAVPAGGRASVRVAGLASGRHEIEVDGMGRGALVIGGQPGP
jgi:hypothetical protein